MVSTLLHAKVNKIIGIFRKKIAVSEFLFFPLVKIAFLVVFWNSGLH